jgi:excinuclease ABC subunit A
MSSNSIVIRGARQHNLANIDLTLPRDQLIVITGISGSGKSSLAFDTIYAEGQRRYVESLSAYARQFLGQMDKPDVDSIEGLSPAISIDQKTTSRNPRSTVGTVTEVYDYLRLLYARIGRPHCPKCGKPISQQTVDQIVDALLAYPAGTRMQILAPLVRGRKGEHQKVLEDVRKAGYVRVRVDGQVREITEEIKLDKNKKHHIEAVVDRVIVRPDQRQRLADSLETTLKLSEGLVVVEVLSTPGKPETPGITGNGGSRVSLESGDNSGRLAASGSLEGPDNPDKPVDFANQANPANPAAPMSSGKHELLFSQNFACSDCGISIEELTPRMFSFNNPYGACPECLGLGIKMEVDPELVVPDREKYLADGAIAPWSNYTGFYYYQMLDNLAEHYGFSTRVPVKDLAPEHLQVVLYGSGKEKIRYRFQNTSGEQSTYSGVWEGAINNLNRRYRESHSEYSKQEIEKYMSTNPCQACKGARLRPETLAVKIGDLNIYELTRLSVVEVQQYLRKVSLTPRERAIAAMVLKEIQERLDFMVKVGLEYLTLDRKSATLSGGEAQRIRLATQIGSSLMGVLYILDEPSIGLHQRDNAKLIETLKRLRDLGNTLIVVEHDEDTIREADFVVDMGPGAGAHGGQVVASGKLADIEKAPESLTGQYFSGRKWIPLPAERRPGNGKWLEIEGARENNLKNIQVRIPLGVFTCVTGVSGSGKSTLINEILYKKLAQVLNRASTKAGDHDTIRGLQYLDKVIEIDQSPIGRTPRSNPATYTGVFDRIRELFSQTTEAKMHGYKPGRFSFNVKGGRCEACKGDGILKIEMHFLPDVYVPCEVCNGKRFNRETLEIRYKGKNIADVLNMTVDEAVEFFQNLPAIHKKLLTLQEVGLGYIRLGQPATTLSGGEAQRVKLATELSRRSTGKTIYLLDEPTTGLHKADVHKLLSVLHKLVEAGDTVIVIEHNLDVIKTADYLIDLGPEGGNRGGEVVAVGTPEEVAAVPQSYTGQYLKTVLEGERTLRADLI